MPTTQRLHRLQELLKELPCDALLLEDAYSLLYLTGLHLSAGKLVVTPTQARLLVDGRYFEAAQHSSPIPVILSGDKAFDAILKELGVHRLAFSADDTTYQRYSELSKQLKEIGATAVDIASPVKMLRILKDEHEITLLREAAKLGSRGYDLVCDLLEEDVSEQELAQELQLFWFRHGGKKTAFDPIIAFGPNSSQPHYRAGAARLQKGQPVLIDIGVTLDDYHSDMTRVVFYGEPEEKMREIYGVVLEAQEAALVLCRPGTAVGDLDRAARQHITQSGYGEFFTHSLGHGLGLEVHEAPGLRSGGPYQAMALQPGMAITIEPGIYLPGLGGVRIEDTVIITADGYEDLTQRSKELRVLAL